MTDCLPSRHAKFATVTTHSHTTLYSPQPTAIAQWFLDNVTNRNLSLGTSHSHHYGSPSIHASLHRRSNSAAYTEDPWSHHEHAAASSPNISYSTSYPTISLRSSCSASCSSFYTIASQRSSRATSYITTYPPTKQHSSYPTTSQSPSYYTTSQPTAPNEIITGIRISRQVLATRE